MAYGDAPRALRVTPWARQADEWAVVLEAAGIPHRLRPVDGGWAIVVEPDDAARAEAALADYERENREPRPDITRLPESPPRRTWLGVGVALALIAAHAVTGPRAAGSVWFERGSADAARILAGEAWRTVTALTLHADLVHVLGNALACVLLVTAVAQWIGPGAGLWLVLLSGVLGNALTALAHGAHHISVGASTSTFGAVGLLAARQLVAPAPHRPGARRRRWVVIVASLLILAMLGTAEGADVLAHVFGLAAGAALGLATALAAPRPPAAATQRLLAVTAVAAVFAAWALAFW